MSRVWFTSDQHFWHTNILRYERRPFKTVKEMNAIITRRYNETVGKGDTVYILGDIASWYDVGREQLEKKIRSLKGRKILIMGNHDNLNPFDYVDMGFQSAHTSLTLTVRGRDIHLVHDPSVAGVLQDELFISGHVHNLFKSINNVVNVGVDVWNFTPAPADEVFSLLWGQTQID